MGGKLKIQHAGNVDVGIPAQNEVGNIGVVGGADGLGATSGSGTIFCVANIEYAPGQYAAGDSYIVRQKGKSKYLVANVADPTRRQVCILVNEPDLDTGNLTSGQMAIQGIVAGGANIAIFSITNGHATGFATDYVSPDDVGDLTTATTYHVSYVAANATPQPGSDLTIIKIAQQ